MKLYILRSELLYQINCKIPMQILNAHPTKERRRITYIFLIFIAVILGLGSRYYSKSLPAWVEMYVGDTLWALNVFLILGFIFIRKSSLYLAIIALIFSFTIEVSQIYHAPWIDGIRAYRLGGLVLGYGFLWSDLICYIAGIAFGIFLEKITSAEKLLFRIKMS